MSVRISFMCHSYLWSLITPNGSCHFLVASDSDWFHLNLTYGHVILTPQNHVAINQIKMKPIGLDSPCADIESECGRG